MASPRTERRLSLALYHLLVLVASACSDTADPVHSQSPIEAKAPLIPVDSQSPPPPPPAVPIATLASITVSSVTETMETASSQEFQVSGMLTNGMPAESLRVLWGASGGEIDQAGHFVAGTEAGLAEVTATVGNIVGSRRLTIVTPRPLAPFPELPALSADAFVNSMGVNVHLGYFDTPYGTKWDAVVKPSILQLGIRHLRDGGTVLSDNSWMQSVYGRMQEMSAHGVKFSLIMRPAVGVTDYSSMAHLSRLMSFAGSAVEAFEGLNEPDVSGRPNWVNETRTFQAALFAAVRANPQTVAIPIYGPSMAQAGNAAALGNLASFLDAGNIHPYPGGKEPLANLLDHQAKSGVISANHPWIATETGYHNAMSTTSGHRPVSEEAAGRYVPRLFLNNFLAGVQRTYLYEMIDEGSNHSEQEQNFGLLRFDGSPKPAYTSLRNTIAILSDPGAPFSPAALPVEIGGETSGVRSTVLAKRDGRYYLILWQEATSFDITTQLLRSIPTREVTVSFPSQRLVGVYLPATASSPTRAAERLNSITLQVTDGLTIVEITP